MVLRKKEGMIYIFLLCLYAYALWMNGMSKGVFTRSWAQISIYNKQFCATFARFYYCERFESRSHFKSRFRRCVCWSSPVREMQRKVKFLAKGTKSSSHRNEFFQHLLILLCRPKVQSLEAVPPDSQSKALPSAERQTQGTQGDSTFLTQQDVDASSLPAALPPVTSAQASAAGAVSSWSKETIV